MIKSNKQYDDIIKLATDSDLPPIKRGKAIADYKRVERTYDYFNPIPDNALDFIEQDREKEKFIMTIVQRRLYKQQ